MKKIFKGRYLTLITAFLLFFGLTFLFQTEAIDAAAAPTGLKQVKANTTSAEICWDTVFGASDMYCFLRISPTADFMVYSVDMAYGTEAYIFDLQAGKTYYVQVGLSREYAYTGSAAPADTVWSAPIEVVTAPTEVDSSTIVQTAATETSISMAWQAAEGATAYDIKYWRSSTNSDTAAKTTAEGSAVTLTGLDKNTEYNIEIYPIRVNTAFRASNSFGTMKWSIPTLPTKIIDLECDYFNSASSSKVSMSLDWAKSAVADGYQYEIYKYNGKKPLVKGTYSYDSLSINSSKLKANQFYKVRVRAYIDTVSNGRAYGKWSDYEYFSRCSAAGTKLKRTGNKLKASWKKVPGAKGYTVYMASKYNGSYKKMGTTKNTSMTLKKTIKKGKYYYVRVVPYYQKGKHKYPATINSNAQYSAYAWYASSGRLYSSTY